MPSEESLRTVIERQKDQIQFFKEAWENEKKLTALAQADRDRYRAGLHKAQSAIVAALV
jgi:hypothetical protein